MMRLGVTSWERAWWLGLGALLTPPGSQAARVLPRSPPQTRIFARQLAIDDQAPLAFGAQNSALILFAFPGRTKNE